MFFGPFIQEKEQEASPKHPLKNHIDHILGRHRLDEYSGGCLLSQNFGGSQKGGFSKRGSGRCSLDPQNRNEGTKNGTTVPEIGTRYTKNRNEGTFAKTTLLQNCPLFPLEDSIIANKQNYEQTRISEKWLESLGSCQTHLASRDSGRLSCNP